MSACRGAQQCAPPAFPWTVARNGEWTFSSADFRTVRDRDEHHAETPAPATTLPAMSAGVSELIPILQVAIGPVILISGIGLLLLSMTNRLGRIVDRSRSLWRELRAVDEADERDRILQQLRHLRRRALLVRWAVTLATLSIFLAAVLIVELFIAALLRLEIAWAISSIFIACLLALIGSVAAFLREIQQSLDTLELEIRIDSIR